MWLLRRHWAWGLTWQLLDEQGQEQLKPSWQLMNVSESIRQPDLLREHCYLYVAAGMRPTAYILRIVIAFKRCGPRAYISHHLSIECCTVSESGIVELGKVNLFVVPAVSLLSNIQQQVLQFLRANIQTNKKNTAYAIQQSNDHDFTKT